MIKEILAPVGSMEACYAAIQAGADAIYLAGKSFGARAYADNFTNEDLADIISYAHVREVKVYVTVNTLIFDREMDELLQYVSFLYEHDCDAVIVQDIGVLKLIRAHFPELDIHASTQMNVHNIKQAIRLKELGVTRIVLARETSIDQMEAIYQATKLEIEVFVHGALCQSYSGNCLLSSFIGKRSGNRGKCAQPCRLPYQLQSDDKDFSEEYYLSMKDLMTLDELEPILKSPIVSLKIEGRMKRPEYVYQVVRTYKYASDQYKKQGFIDIQDSDIKELKKLFNREFTKGYLLKENFGNVVNTKRPNHMGILVGKVIDYSNKVATIELQEELTINDGIRFVGNADFGMIVQQMSYKNDKVKKGYPSQTISLVVTEPVVKGMSVYKTSDYEQLKALKVDTSKEVKKVSIQGSIEMNLGQKAKLELRDARGNEVIVYSSDDVVLASNVESSTSRYIEQIKKTGNTPFVIEHLDAFIQKGSYLSIKEINEMRRIATSELIEKRKKIHGSRKMVQTPSKIPTTTIPQSTKGLRILCHTLEQLEVAIIYGIDEIYYDDLDTLDQAMNLKEDVIPVLPRIDFEEDINVASSKVVVSQIGDLDLINLKSVITDLYLNVVNSESVHYLHQIGVSRVTLSPEVSYLQMRELMDEYHKKYQTLPNLEVVVYGFYEAMIMKHCIISSTLGYNVYDCNACYINQYTLVDRLGYRFSLMRGHNCALKMLNAKRLSLLDQVNDIFELGIHSVRIQLTLETKEETNRVIQAFTDKLQGNDAKLPFQDLTFGHFKERIE